MGAMREALVRSRPHADASVSRAVACGTPRAGTSTLVSRLESRVDDRATADPCSLLGAERALVVLDVSSGLTPTAHTAIGLAWLLAVPRVVVAVTKMDLVAFAEEPFRRVRAEVDLLTSRLGLAPVLCIPVSGLHGDNVLARDRRMPWYEGPALSEELSGPVEPATPFRFWVERPDGVGTVASGRVTPGDPVVILPSGQESRIERVAGPGGELDHARAGQAVTLTLADPLEVAPGDLISAPVPRAGVGDQFEATLVWLADAPPTVGQSFMMGAGSQRAPATITSLARFRDLESLEPVDVPSLHKGDFGTCELVLGRRIAFDPHRVNRQCGAFTLYDPHGLEVAAAGLLNCAVRRSQDVCWQAIDVGKAARAALKRQRPCIVWLTGLPSAGKSTIANLLERRLHGAGYHTYLLDGDNVRHGLNKDLGFDAAGRTENIRRVGEVARLMVDAGLIAICSFVSPFTAGRRAVRTLVEPDEFIEVFVDASLKEAQRRDPKGLYRKAQRGELVDFTGVDAPYEAPERPEVHLDADRLAPEESVELVIEALIARGAIEASAAV